MKTTWFSGLTVILMAGTVLASGDPIYSVSVQRGSTTNTRQLRVERAVITARNSGAADLLTYNIYLRVLEGDRGREVCKATYRSPRPMPTNQTVIIPLTFGVAYTPGSPASSTNLRYEVTAELTDVYPDGRELHPLHNTGGLVMTIPAGGKPGCVEPNALLRH